MLLVVKIMDAPLTDFWNTIDFINYKNKIFDPKAIHFDQSTNNQFGLNQMTSAYHKVSLVLK